MTAWAEKGDTSTSLEVCLKRSTLTPPPAVARGNGLDGGDLGEVVHGRKGPLAGAVDRRHPVAVSFVGDHTLRILRSGWASRKRGLPIRRY